MPSRSAMEQTDEDGGKKVEFRFGSGWCDGFRGERGKHGEEGRTEAMSRRRLVDGDLARGGAFEGRSVNWAVNRVFQIEL